MELYVTDIETILINSLPTDSSSSGSVAYIMNNDGILIAVSDSSQVYQYTTSTLINTVDSLPFKAIESSNKLISSSSSYLRDNYLYKTDNSIVSIAVWCVCVATITITTTTNNNTNTHTTTIITTTTTTTTTDLHD